MKKVSYRVWYRVQDIGSYVEVMLFVENNFGEVLVDQKEGMFDSMEDASHLVSYLESIGADIEYVETVSYTG